MVEHSSIYKLDAESRKLRALESRGGPGLSAFERSEDATKGPQGALMRVVSMDEASNFGNACAQFKFGASEMANERCFLAGKSSERPREDVDNGLASTSNLRRPLGDSAQCK